jgi:hypothetical protein
MAATWIVFGYQGVLEFELLRKNTWLARKKHSKGQKIPILISDAFHNGADVLKEVKEWHQCLRLHARASDKITPIILDVVDQKMLLAIPSERMNTIDLCDELDRLIKHIEDNPAPAPPASISRFLQKIDERAANNAIDTFEKLLKMQKTSSEQSLTSSNTEVLSTSRRFPFMKTSHRSQSTPADVNKNINGIQGQCDSGTNPTGGGGDHTDPKAHRVRHSDASELSTDLLVPRINSVAQSSEMDPFSSPIHAHIQNQVEREKSFLRRLKKERPDKQLEHWFQGRDIVCGMFRIGCHY